MNVRPFPWIGLLIGGWFLALMSQAAGVLTVELPPDRRAARGWPLHFQWQSFSNAPTDTHLVIQGTGGVELNLSPVSPGQWWLSGEQTQALPLGPATARVGQSQVPLELVDLT